jgi:hypothetical protein
MRRSQARARSDWLLSVSLKPNASRSRGGGIDAVTARYHCGGRKKIPAPEKICPAISRAAGLTVRTSDSPIISA